MKRNTGSADRILRILVTAVVGYLYYTGVIEGTLAYVLLGMAAIFVLTSLINFCPANSLLEISIGGKKNKV